MPDLINEDSPISQSTILFFIIALVIVFCLCNSLDDRDQVPIL